jgi:hypothetical protein
MPTIIKCPRCQSTLRTPPGASPETFTCPRCLAEVANPGGQPSASAVQVAPRDGGDSMTECQECGERVNREWRYCPNCQEPLGGTRRRRSYADVDVRRDSTGVSVWMILLAILGGTGISLMLLGSISAGKEGLFAVVAWVVAILFVVGLIAALTVLLSSRKRSPAATVGVIAFRSLAFAGMAFLALFLFCVAVGIFFFVVCKVEQQGWH